MFTQTQLFNSDIVSHGFFNRSGGVSEGLYNSLNCSAFVGDNEENVSTNLSIVSDKLGAKKLFTLKQVHGSTCVIADENTENHLEADAIVTKSSLVAIGVLTADCAPILFVDEETKIIGAAHAGWKGAMRGVIQSTLATMTQIGANLDTIKAAIGPCISKESYEVGDDFKREFKGSGSCFSLIKMRLHFDLSKYCKEILMQSGVNEKHIDLIGVDTFTNHDQYFSYRYANQNSNGICGRNISAIALK